MGWHKHEAIVFTSHFKEDAKEVRAKAITLGLEVTNLVCSYINCFWSFMVIPDGSKEGWEDSTNCEHLRELLLEDVGTINWAHVSFGGDYPENAKLVNHNGKEETT